MSEARVAECICEVGFEISGKGCCVDSMNRRSILRRFEANQEAYWPPSCIIFSMARMLGCQKR